MKATTTRNAFSVTVHCYDVLRAPDDQYGRQCKWLPCERCHELAAVPVEVVSHECDDCMKHLEMCDDYDCQHVAHSDHDSHTTPYERQERSGDAY
jgi:hypothetical protein